MSVFIDNIPLKPSNNSHSDRDGNGGYMHAQFVPGHVCESITYTPYPYGLKDDDNNEQFLANDERYVNNIRAVKHTSKTLQDMNIECLTADEYRPLFRGMVDTPTQGDQVLLCKFGEINYYIGPINTINHPNFNPDHLFNLSNPEKIVNVDASKLDPKSIYNYNPDYSFQPNIKRLHKFPIDIEWNLSSIKNLNPATKPVGDMIFEGRCGNSIRIGNRSGTPNIIISNGRNHSNTFETLQDGGLISMTSIGTFKDIFIVNDFIPSSNVEKTNKRLMEFDNEYSKSQILIRSDRIIIDSKSNKIVLSSNKSIDIGTGTNVNVKSGGDVVIDSNRVILSGHKPPERGSKGTKVQAAVLGDELVDVLKKIIENIGNLHVAAVMAGISSPVSAGGSPGWAQLIGISNSLDRIKSKYVFIQKDEGKS